MWNSPGSGRITVTNGRAIRCASRGTGVSGGDQIINVSGTGTGAITVNGLYALSEDNVSLIENTATTRGVSTVSNVIAITQNTSADGNLGNGINAVTNAWARNVGGLLTSYSGASTTTLRSVYAFMGTDTGTAALAPYGTFRGADNIIVNKPNAVLVNEALASSIEWVRNVVESASATTNGFSGVFISTDAPLGGQGFRDNLFIRSVMFSCGDATWGAANQARIGFNAMAGATNGTAITNAGTNCVLSQPPAILSLTTFAANRIGGWPQYGSFGPSARVGVPPGADVYDVMSGAIYYTDWSGGRSSPLYPSAVLSVPTP